MTSRGRGRPPHPEILTPAEQRVLDELRKGGTNAEIAERLGVTLDAVKYHVSNMLGKLELDNRQQLAAWRPERRRLLGLLAAPAGLESLGRPLRWVGVTSAGAGAVAIVVVVLLVLSTLDGSEQQLAATPTPSPPEDAVATPTPTPPEDPLATPMSAPPGGAVVQLFAPRDLMCAVQESGGPDLLG